MKTLVINIAIFCTLWFVVHLALITEREIRGQKVRRGAHAALPNYVDHDWAKTHFEEFLEQDWEFRSYVGWRRYPYSGKTITVDERGLRRTVDRTPGQASKSLLFFGGSTTWGTGVSDDFTIPSHAASLTEDYRVTNYGEAAYTAHQSLETLIRLLQAGERPDVVVFYDGVNDVKYKCMKNHNWYSHGREHHYGSKVARADAVLSFEYALEPLRYTALRVKRVILGDREGANRYNCHENPEKAERVAAALVEDWKIARMLVEAHGGRFFAFLQPISYFSQTKLEYIAYEEGLREQYELIYPMIRQNADALEVFTDLTDLFDRDEYIYVDYAHVGPNGNKYAAERILSVIEGDGG